MVARPVGKDEGCKAAAVALCSSCLLSRTMSLSCGRLASQGRSGCRPCMLMTKRRSRSGVFAFESSPLLLLTCIERLGFLDLSDASRFGILVGYPLCNLLSAHIYISFCHLRIHVAMFCTNSNCIQCFESVRLTIFLAALLHLFFRACIPSQLNPSNYDPWFEIGC